MRIQFLLLVLIYAPLHGQQNVKVISENKEGGFILFASNDAFCPMSVSLGLRLENLEEGEGLQELYVVPARTDKFKLLELDVKNPKKKSTFSSSIRYNMGNTSQEKFDEGHGYLLPFRKGMKFMVFQGYNGKASHQNESALDFTMPEGTEILASRDGIVVKVEEGNTKSCPEEACKQYNNYVIIYHADGTMAEYTHIRKVGALVSVGDKVKAGDPIAFSGNIGWTTGPHLHFVCFLQRMESRSTVPTKFLIDDGKKAVLLEEKSSYTRGY